MLRQPAENRQAAGKEPPAIHLVPDRMPAVAAQLLAVEGTADLIAVQMFGGDARLMQGPCQASAVRLHPHSIAHDNVKIAMICTFHRRTVEIDGNIVVTIQKSDILADSLLRPRDPGCKQTAVLLMGNNAEAAVLGRIVCHDARRMIGRAIVDQDELRLPERLCRQGIKAFAQILFRAIDRHDHRKPDGHAAHSPFLTAGKTAVMFHPFYHILPCLASRCRTFTHCCAMLLRL